MGRINAGLVEFLEEDDWNYSQEEKNDDAYVYFSYTGPNGTVRCTIICREKLEVVSMYSRLEVTVPEHKRHQAAEYLSRANWGLLIGNFELDFRDGEVRYKSSADFEGAETTTTCYRNLLHANLSTADRYYPALMKMLWSDDLTPEDAIAQVEGEGE